MRFRGIAVFVSVAALMAIGQADASAAAPPLPTNDSFYSTGLSSTALAKLKPGDVIKQRPVQYTLTSGVPATYSGVQLLYRTSGESGQPEATVATVFEPATQPVVPKLISDQFFYDALDAKCDPSYYFHNDGSSGGGTNSIEGPALASLLASGNTVVTSDYEGRDLAWTAGPKSGRQTLDGIRAASNYKQPTAESGYPPALPSGIKVGILGYSGGAIASEWAAELAAKYAPDVSSRLLGTAIGGIYVYPAHNLKYVSGSPKWSGVTPGALLGLARGFGIDINSYASAYGKKLIKQASTSCIDELLGKYPGLTFKQLVKPQYADFEKVPAFVKLNNALIMSTGGTPSAPMYMAQGTDTTGMEMTPNNKPGIGPGDGVMIAGDTRSLARTYCQRGVSVEYQTFESGHTDTFVPFFGEGVAFLNARLAGAPAPQNCSSIAPGNSLAPLPTPKATTTPTTHSTSSAKHPTATHSTTSSAGANALADTGPQQTQRLLLWAALLLCLGSGLLWAARRPRALLAVTAQLPRRPLPGPAPTAWRPLPYRRD